MKLLGTKYSLAAWLHLAVRLAWFLSILGIVLLGVVMIFALRWGFLAMPGSSSVFVYPGPALRPVPDLRGDTAIARPIGDLYTEVELVTAAGSLEFSPGSRVVTGLTTLTGVVLSALYLVVLHRLKAITGTLASGRPFTPENASRIRTIGLVVVAGWSIDIAGRIASQLFAQHHFALEHGSFSAWFVPKNFSILFLGLLILVIAGVFRVGARLQEDQDATI